MKTLMLLKRYIDYLFWKRTWFRIFFVLIPSWIVPFAYFLGFGEPNSDIRNIYCLAIVLMWMIALSDNDNIDNPPNPFKKINGSDILKKK